MSPQVKQTFGQCFQALTPAPKQTQHEEGAEGGRNLCHRVVAHWPWVTGAFCPSTSGSRKEKKKKKSNLQVSHLMGKREKIGKEKRNAALQQKAVTLRSFLSYMENIACIRAKFQ